MSSTQTPVDPPAPPVPPLDVVPPEAVDPPLDVVPPEAVDPPLPVAPPVPPPPALDVVPEVVCVIVSPDPGGPKVSGLGPQATPVAAKNRQRRARRGMTSV